MKIQVMGILNVTPDSFFAASRKQTEKDIVERVHQMMDEGADMIDVGAYSSRPNAAFVSEDEELQRMRFGLEILFREAPNAVVSVDTFRAKVARESVEKFGAAIINDISGFELDDQMSDTVADLKVPYILMHIRGNPQSMMEPTNTQYADFVPDVMNYFKEKIQFLHEKGVTDIWVDPGFGFSKTTDQNYELLNHLEEFQQFGLPVLVGFSRKTMIREVTGVPSEEALNGTTALNMFSLTQGATILRVHDVKEAVQTVQLFNKITQR
ncbi:dihydropteroate synthase [Bacteroidia bacterium]|nr:dihydropteroate synthase [Bacteroidia bacterium]